MGPRQELVEEIKKFANVDFHMYSSERFLSYGQSFLKEQINQQALQEIQAMKKAEMEEIKNLRFKEFKEFKINQNEFKINEEIEYYKNRVNEINHKKHELEIHIHNLISDAHPNDEIHEHIHNLGIHKAEFDQEKKELINLISDLEKSTLKNRKNDNYNDVNNRLRKFLYEKDSEL